MFKREILSAAGRKVWVQRGSVLFSYWEPQSGLKKWLEFLQVERGYLGHQSCFKTSSEEVIQSKSIFVTESLKVQFRKDPDAGKDWRQAEKGMTWLDVITDKMHMSLIVKVRQAWPAAVHGVTNSWTGPSNCTTNSNNNLKVLSYILLHYAVSSVLPFITIIGAFLKLKFVLPNPTLVLYPTL